MIEFLGLPKTVLRFVAEGMTRKPARMRTEGACLALLWTTSGEYQRGAPTIPHTCLFSLQGLGEASEEFTTDLYAA